MEIKISQKLLEEYRKYDLKKNFGWGSFENCPISIPNKYSNFDKNIHLRENFHTKLDSDNYLNGAYWIIRDWGGIRSFQKNDKNDELLKKFREKLKTNPSKLLKSEFETISSLSKVASFLMPYDYAIYDSRVIYSLNWFIFIFGLDSKFYPQPIGRNAELEQFDQKTIFNLSGKEVEYYDKKEAYPKYCKLLKETATLENDIKIYNLEMFLFSIAPTIIRENIKNTVSISVKKEVKIEYK